MKDKGVNWLSKQYSRFDLALAKVGRPLVVLNTISNVSAALVLAGAPLLAFVLFAGSVVLGIVGYGLHRTGFFMQTVSETFDQQSKELWERQNRYFALIVAKYQRLSEDELEREIAQARKELRL